MDNLAEQLSFDLPYEDSMIRARADMLRAVIQQIPRHQRAGVFELVRDLLPQTIIGHPNAPQRGGEVLKNVYELFRRAPSVPKAAPEVQAELAKATQTTVEPQSVRNALNYLNQRRILRRVGYGRYILEDGSLITTTEMEGS